MHPVLDLQILVLLTLANGSPVIAKKLLGDRFAFPLDGGVVLVDGRPLFGGSKTVRGLVLAILVTSSIAPLFGVAWQIGFIVGTMAMAGDLLSSFIKRRLNLPASSQATGLDQIPGSLFPLLACSLVLPLTPLDMIVVAVAFLLGEIILSRLLYRLRIRDRPY